MGVDFASRGEYEKAIGHFEIAVESNEGRRDLRGIRWASLSGKPAFFGWMRTQGSPPLAAALGYYAYAFQAKRPDAFPG